ncbi:MAG: hypothetical protein IJH07_07920 [Ruminococcus sp.]|nr:hypothetical protein [Ruminococcus sp.]
MRNTFLRNRTVQRIIKWIVALSFALFTFYQIILAIIIESTRVGRLIGIVFYLLITVAAFLGLIRKRYLSEAKIEKIENAQSVLMIIGLILLFITRLLSVVTVFGNLSFANPASVLYAATYILSQLGTLVLVAGYIITLKYDLTEKEMKKFKTIWMSIAIVLYALCFIAECVMLIKYRFNIDLSLFFTLISRIWYFLGFAGSAFCVILPEPIGRKHKSGSFYYSEDDEEEVDLVM